MKKHPLHILIIGIVGLFLGACVSPIDTPLAQQPLPSPPERQLDTDGESIHFEMETGQDYNGFEHPDGLFRLEYLNHLALKYNRGVYFLEDIRDQTVVFQIFEKRDNFRFDDNDYICQTYTGKDSFYEGKTLCFSFLVTDQIVANLELFAEPDVLLKEDFELVQSKHPNGVEERVYRYDFLTRAQMLELALGLKYPDRNFDEYADDCFYDVSKDHPLSGYICFAKSEGIVIGISGAYYPESSINLFGVLKILFLTFEIDDREFDPDALDQHLFEKMGMNHYAYPLVSKALYEGLIENPKDLLLWSNQHAYKGEVMQITSRFLQWIDGKDYKNYDSDIQSVPTGTIEMTFEEPLYRFEGKLESSIKEPQLIESVIIEGNRVLISDRGNLYLDVLELDPKMDVVSGTGFHNYARHHIGIQFDFEDGKSVYYETNPKKNQFRYVEETKSDTDIQAIREQLAAMQLLPNPATRPDDNELPHAEIHMTAEDFFDIYTHRTSDQRYPAHVFIHYPTGETRERSIFIKTRGNATRGYIKSSYTIEAFADFGNVKGFKGDGYLADHDEMKLRSFVNEETMLHEKLFYQTFSELGNPAPDFFELTLEVNGVDMGLYQATEPIKNPFFERRDIDTENYFYARNIASIYPTNLQYHVDDQTTLSQFEIDGDPFVLIDLIKRLDADDPELIHAINIQNVFDYALLTYMADAGDSLTHNYYVYFDEGTQQWNIFPWDADDSFSPTFAYDESEFKAYVARDQDWFNNLIRYTFSQLDDEQYDGLLEDFKRRWNNDVHLVDWATDYQERYHDYFIFDNTLWNDRHLERKQTHFDTPAAVERLIEELKRLESPFGD